MKIRGTVLQCSLKENYDVSMLQAKKKKGPGGKHSFPTTFKIADYKPKLLEALSLASYSLHGLVPPHVIENVW